MSLRQRVWHACPRYTYDRDPVSLKLASWSNQGTRWFAAWMQDVVADVTTFIHMYSENSRHDKGTYHRAGSRFG
ncbi:hypothetical protein SXCC_01206 [Gluconacetobacter sp. SXCC-1]|nr:hypothetical protein CT154_15280 [Komagataeibacter xylinus]EGG77813.1 hypothetical protein SXCC_01206 [Gluconacetobacter sp. SXCC-1]